MAKYYAVITQKGNKLEITHDEFPCQFSDSIPIQIVKDSAYKDWVLVPYGAYNARPTLNPVVVNEGTPLVYGADGKVTIPRSLTCRSGYLFITVALTNPTSGETVYLNPVRFQIEKSITDLNFLVDVSWESLVTSFMETYMRDHYTTKMDELIKKATELQTKNEVLETKVTQQQAQIDSQIAKVTEKLSEMDTAKSQMQSDIQGAITDANSKVADMQKKINQAITDTQSQLEAQLEANNGKLEQQLSENEQKLNEQLEKNDGKVDAQIAEVQDALEKKSTEVDNRLGDLQTLYDTVEGKLSNGGFVGQQGPQGIPGPKGDKGDPGENGVITEISSFFTLSVDSNGDLWVSYSDNDKQPPLEYNDEEGNLYWVTEEDRGEV